MSIITGKESHRGEALLQDTGIRRNDVTTFCFRRLLFCHLIFLTPLHLILVIPPTITPSHHPDIIPSPVSHCGFYLWSISPLSSWHKCDLLLSPGPPLNSELFEFGPCLTYFHISSTPHDACSLWVIDQGRHAWMLRSLRVWWQHKVPSSRFRPSWLSRLLSPPLTSFLLYQIKGLLLKQKSGSVFENWIDTWPLVVPSVGPPVFTHLQSSSVSCSRSPWSWSGRWKVLLMTLTLTSRVHHVSRLYEYQHFR